MSGHDFTETTVIEPQAPFRCAADIVLGDGLRDCMKRREFGPCTNTEWAANWRTSQSTLFPAFGLVFKDGKAIESTHYCVGPNEEALARKYIAGNHRHLGGRRYFLGLNRFCLNYFHTLVQIIPAIAGYQRCPGFSNAGLLVASPTPLLLRALELADIGSLPDIIKADPAVPLDIDDFTFSSFLFSSGFLSPFSLSVFDRMIKHATAPSAVASTAKRIIYVSRADTDARPLRNEDELVERLIDDFGVEPVILSTLGLDEQITLFQDAHMIIGPHGAGLANIVFCSPGAVLYEFLPDHYINSAINRLAQLRGVHYWCDVHKAEPKPGLWRHQTPWTANIESVQGRINEIVLRYGIV